MITYVFECTSCNHRFEERQGMFEERKANCPKCGARAEFRPSWTGQLLFNFPSLDATEIMNREGKWNY